MGSRTVVLVLGVSLTMAAPARSQDTAALDRRLSSWTAREVRAQIDSARAEGLPTRPLALKALEGASAGAEGEVIVRAVRKLRARLEGARDLLGDASESELTAAATALQIGVEPVVLRDLRAHLGEEPVDVPLVVLTDLVQRGVPAREAGRALVRLAEARVGPEALLRLRMRVERDIRAGAAPEAALAARTRGVLLDGGGPPPGGVHEPLAGPSGDTP